MPAAIPLPPPELRHLVGPSAPADYDNPSGWPLLHAFGIPPEAYAAVFDFGCGCGRQARQLLLQQPRPRRYVGIDVHPGMIEWCRQHLTPIDPSFEFFHHDVYSPSYAPGNTLRLAQPFPVEDAAFSLVIAHSVFTHLMNEQAEYYLSELSRILAPDGMAYTTWLFYDRASFRFLPQVYSLYTNAIDFGQAVLFDREWFLAAVRKCGLGVRLTVPPPVPGHQWNVVLQKRGAGMEDRFPLGADGAEWVCGATLKPMAADAAMTPDLVAKLPPTPAVYVQSETPAPPPLFGYLAELAALKRTHEQVLRSRAWAIGRALTSPVRFLGRFF
jgi:SAM-dependent methyltransferase